MRSGATGSVRINGLDVVRAALVVRNVVQAMQVLERYVVWGLA